MVIEAPELHPIPVVSTWHHIGIDFIGPVNPVSRFGSRYILTISDYYSKFVFAIPTKTKEACYVSAALVKVILLSTCI